ncbi:MAG TPA: S9 family peptidase [Steroidobacteraceae bacterium]|nr:S9 family peptidase [Steroidobacteraceae bacterium]
MRLSSFAILALTVAGAVCAAPADAPSHVFEGKDLFSLQSVTDPQIRPDGRAVAYVRATYDIMTDRARHSIWVVDTDTGEQTPLVAGAASSYSPRWSPDGKRLAYVSVVDHRAQLYVRWLQAQQAARITDLTEAPDDLEWSRDGQFIAFTMHAPDEKASLGSAPAKPEGATWAEPLTVITDLKYRSDGEGYLKPGYSHVFVVPAEGGFPRQITFGAFNDDGPLAWAADGRSILFSGNRKPGWQHEAINTQIYQVAVADSSVTALTNRSGPDRLPRVSADGKKVAYVGYDDRLLGYQNVHVYLMDRDGSHSHSITDSLDRSVEDVRWASDGRSLFVQYTDKAVTKVARLSLDGHLQTLAEGLGGSGLDRPYSGGDFSVSANGTVAFTAGGADHPPDLGVARGTKVTRLTRLNDALFAVRNLAGVKPLEVSSSVDKRRIDAWMVTPPGFDAKRKYPLILEIHGGPYASYGWLFSTDDQLYAAAGYVVVYSNPRGSTSYGEEFANFIQHDYPSHDYDDLMSVVDAAIATGSIDPEQLFVTGGSGGGVLTSWIVGRTNRFRAAVTQKPVINWGSFALTTDIATYVQKYWFAKLPWEDPQTYWKHSPLSLVGNVTTPTMVMVGAEDFRTPVSDSEQYYEALQLRGIPTALVKVPGASHGGLAARPSQSAAEVSAIIAWFDRYRQAPRWTPGAAAANAPATSPSSGR